MPVVDAIASDYQDEVSFLAVAGRAGLDRTTTVAQQLLSDNVPWGLDESIWELYGVLGQPFTVLVTGDDRIVGSWFGLLPEEDIRAQLDALVALGV